ncbi:MAG: ParA family protein [Sphingomonadaceae bacterium]|uniref:ParA family protein n=1 Tax=Thermaurantiacus sp. TaxID=2820283 RepID=UPI00298EE440|nr:ParA family protein [Thermaurantiacus sp.]MCS6987109.1 ParA family protein [Sphingomonadaceae bacterium]MDW8415553.1 ParA family protein [Thermaurantiacus sp.]
MKSLALFSLKGGVGKSTAAVNLAHVAATAGGRRTLLWDLDAQGGATFLVRGAPVGRVKARAGLTGDGSPLDLIVPSEWAGLDLLPADRSLRRVEGDLARAGGQPLRRHLKALAADYDRVILDCPPGLSELATRVFRAVDLVVVPVIPSPLSVRALEQLEAELARLGDEAPPVLAFWSLADRRRRLHRAALDTAPHRAVVPASALVEAMAEARRPLGALAPRSPVARAYAALWSAVEVALVRG